MESDKSGTLRTAGGFSILKYIVTPDGDPRKPRSIRFSEFGNLDELIPVPPPTTSAASSIIGPYRSDTTGTDVTIYETDGRLEMKAMG
jgi:hypothetical protein